MYHRVVLITMLLLVSVFLPIPVQAQPCDYPEMSDTVLTHAFEAGRSLVVGEVQNILQLNETGIGVNIYGYRTKIMEIIIAGDLNASEIIDTPIILFAGASYGDALIPNNRYLMFIMRDLNYGYSWAHRDNYINVSGDTGVQITGDFKMAANSIYEQTFIHRFRESQIDTNVSLPVLTDTLVNTCSLFREIDSDRNECAKYIACSVLGSKEDTGNFFSSFKEYLPPEVKLSNDQVICLFGQPSGALGASYYYYCGEVDIPEDDRRYRGVLTVQFDDSFTTSGLRYFL